MASLSDILTVGKNIVTAINSLGQIGVGGRGNITSATVTSTTLICTGGGGLINVSVTVAGSTAGKVYNSSTTAGASAANTLIAVNPSDGIGVVQAGQLFTLGLVVTPGTGQSLNVTYYQS